MISDWKRGEWSYFWPCLSLFMTAERTWKEQCNHDERVKEGKMCLKLLLWFNILLTFLWLINQSKLSTRDHRRNSSAGGKHGQGLISTLRISTASIQLQNSRTCYNDISGLSLTPYLCQVLPLFTRDISFFFFFTRDISKSYNGTGWEASFRNMINYSPAMSLLSSEMKIFLSCSIPGKNQTLHARMPWKWKSNESSNALKSQTITREGNSITYLSE